MTTAFNATNGTTAIETVSSITRYLTVLLTSGVGTPAPDVATPALAASASVVANVLNGTTAINQMASLTQEVAQALTTAFNATNGTAAIETVSSITRYLTSLLTSGVGTPAPYVATPALAASASVVANVLNGTSAIETMAPFITSYSFIIKELEKALPTPFNATTPVKEAVGALAAAASNATTPVPLVSEGDRVAGYYNEMIGLAVALALVSIVLIGLVVSRFCIPHHDALPHLVAHQGEPSADPQGGHPPAIEMGAAPQLPVFNSDPHMVGQQLAQVEAQVVVGREQKGLHTITHTTTCATTYI